MSLNAPLLETPAGTNEQLRFERACLFINEASKGTYHASQMFDTPASQRAITLQDHPLLFYTFRVSVLLYMLLAFFERPSWCLPPKSCGDPGVVLFSGLPWMPLWLGPLLDLLCMLVFSLELVLKCIACPKAFRSSKWNILQSFVVAFSLIDIVVSFLDSQGVIPGSTRLSRLIRPLVFVATSRRVRSSFWNICRVVPQVMDVVVLVVIIIVFFGWFAMLLFQGSSEGGKYFSNFGDSFWSLLVLLTTANYPNVMQDAYNDLRVSIVFFVLFLILCLYLSMNLVLAVVWNSYRELLKEEIVTLLERRRAALYRAYACLCDGTGGSLTCEAFTRLLLQLRPGLTTENRARELFNLLDRAGDGVVSKEEFVELCNVLKLKRKPLSTRAPETWKRMKTSHWHAWLLKMVTHTAFEYCIDACIVANAVTMVFETLQEMHQSTIPIWQYAEVPFTLIYTIEMVLKLVAFGPSKYIESWQNKFDGLITVVADVTEIYVLIPNSFNNPLFVRYILLVRLLRLLRILAHIQRYKIIFSTFLGLVPAVAPVFGVLIAFYYLFATIGVEAFGGAIYKGNPALEGTDFQSNDYYANNFNDFGSAMATLFELMVVNNWYVIVDGICDATTQGARAYFITYYFGSVVIALNVTVALILDTFKVEYDVKMEATTTAKEKEAVEERRALQQQQSFVHVQGREYTREAVLLNLFRSELSPEATPKV